MNHSVKLSAAARPRLRARAAGRTTRRSRAMGESRNVYVEPDERAVIRTADVYQTEVEAGTGGY